MSDTQPSGATPDLRHLPLDQLEIAPHNVRTVPASAGADAELKASVAAHGILENLVVHPTASGRFAVIAGARRLAAAQSLARDGVLAPDHPVPCRIEVDDARACELSLVENTARAAMHPADQAVAFRALADAGATPDAIATRFGVSERVVAQRLRLGNVAPELLDAYRAGEVRLETVAAFAFTTDHERQRAVWSELTAQGYVPNAWQIKRRLSEGRVPANAAVARFVGVDAYEAAGGQVTRDLFAGETETGIWLDDPERLHKLAEERLEAAAERLRPDWAWVEAHVELEWNATGRYARVRPEPAAENETERTERERLEARLETLENVSADDWNDELEEELETAEERLTAINEGIEDRATFRPEDRAVAGCIVTIDHRGALEVKQGLVRPQTHASGAASSNEGSEGVPDPAGEAGTQPDDCAAEARKAAGMSKKRKPNEPVEEMEATQDEHAKAIVDARDAGKEIPRRVQHARVSDGPKMRRRKVLDREGRNGCAFAEAVRCEGTRTVVLPGGLRLRTARGISDGGDVVSCQIVERTPRRYARRRRCEPKDRTFAVHLQRRVAAPLNTSVRRMRYEKGIRPTHYVDPDRVAGGVVGTDTGVVRELTLVGPGGDTTVVEGPTERQRAQDERATKKAKRLGKGHRRTRRKAEPGRRARAAQQLRIRNARRRTNQRRDRVCKAVKRALDAPGVTAVATDALNLGNMTASARGTEENPGRNMRQKTGLNRSLSHAAPGETNAIVRRCAEKLGLWVVKGRPAYGSVTCPRCAHVDRKSRESQSRFRCTACGYADHADSNAARVSQLRARKRLSAYLDAVRASQRHEEVVSKPAKRLHKHTPVLRVLASA